METFFLRFSCRVKMQEKYIGVKGALDANTGVHLDFLDALQHRIS